MNVLLYAMYSTPDCTLYIKAISGTCGPTSKGAQKELGGNEKQAKKSP